MKIHEHDAGHITKMAAMFIYDKNPSKFSPEPLDQFPQDFLCGIWDSSPS